MVIQEDLEADPEAPTLLPFLSAHIRQSQPARGIFDVKPDWKSDARARANTTLAQRLRRLLEWIATRSQPGRFISYPIDEIAPFVDARDELEVHFLLRHLEALKYISLTTSTIPSDKRPPSGSGEVALIQMQVSGWEAVSPLAGSGIAGMCFVAMSFDSSLNDVYKNGIVAAVEHDCGFNVVRIDRVEHNDDITDQILSSIRASQFVIADFTKQRAGVYFEAGFAAGLGRTVIWTCHADDFDQLHFDTRQRNHIKWTTPADLRTQLKDRIRATVALQARFSV